MTRRVVIVGNGAIGCGLADIIDAADLVIRFNDCRSVGPGGRRTDIVAVCNTGRPGKAMLEGADWLDNPAVRLASAIWCVRDPMKFAALRGSLAVSHPDLDDFCDDYTEGFSAHAHRHGKGFHVISASTHEWLERELSSFARSPYVVPSSGAVLIAEFLTYHRGPNDEVHLAGFGHQGWRWHPWAAERAWVEDMIARGKVQRLANSAGT